MLCLLCRLPNNEGITPMSDVFGKHIKDLGNQLVDTQIASLNAPQEESKDEKKDEVNLGDDTVFVRNVIKLYDKYTDIIRAYCGSCILFKNALTASFNSFLNRDVVCCAYSIS